MNRLQNGMLQLIAAALTESPRELPADLDWSEVVKVGKKHQILPLLYYGVLQTQAAVPSEIKEAMEMATFRQVMVCQNQQYALDCLFAAFDAAGVDYMPLKGILLKQMYPKAEMRRMGDADVLIRVDQYHRIKPLMLTLGFAAESESDHELVWKSPSLYLELHKRLIPSYNKDYYAYYGDGWQLAKVKEGSRHQMTDADEFIYLFTHFAKHYRDGGIGIKHMTDLWVYRRCHPNLDEEYVLGTLAVLQLDTFYAYVSRALSVWFEGAIGDERTDFITDFIFNSGEFGLRTNRALSDGARLSRRGGHAKRRKVMRLVFLPYGDMCVKYPCLKRVPILLPVMWGWRILEALLFRGDRIRINKENLRLMKAEDIRNYRDALHFVGLDFHF